MSAHREFLMTANSRADIITQSVPEPFFRRRRQRRVDGYSRHRAVVDSLQVGAAAQLQAPLVRLAGRSREDEPVIGSACFAQAPARVYQTAIRGGSACQDFTARTLSPPTCADTSRPRRDLRQPPALCFGVCGALRGSRHAGRPKMAVHNASVSMIAWRHDRSEASRR
jgi:hypothetical protein